MIRGESRNLRVSPELIETVLNQLDARESASQRNRRRNTRYKYRSMSVVVEFPHRDGQMRYVVPTRDLSRGGMAFLIGHYIHPGVRCRVRLVSEYNVRRDVVGTVARCIYVSGTAGLHEVGVAFDEPIDMALFHRGASSSRVLIVDDDSSSSQLLGELFRRLNVEVVHVEADGPPLDAALDRPFDLLLINRDAQSFAACDVVRRLRQRGYVRPIVSITTQTLDLAEASCQKDACHDCRLIPLTRESLSSLIGRVRSEPVVSAAGHDATMSGTVNAFVANVATHTQALEAAFAKGDNTELTQRLQRLSVLAAAAGFDVIEKQARRVVELSGAGAPAHEVRDALGELSLLCHAARPATLTEPAPQPADAGPGLS